MKKNNIGVLITIIILLCISLPGAIYGTYMHNKDKALGGNPNKEFYHEGKLFFYNLDKLLGTYTCETDKCGYAKNSINNQNFDNFNSEATEIKLINNHYAFIEDGEKIILYDVSTETKIIEYKEVKNYTIGIENDYYLVKNANNLWGMIKVADNVSVAIQNKYEYLGLKAKLNQNNKYDATRVIAKNAEGWKLITNDNNIVASSNSMIVDYSDYFIVTVDNKLYDYNNNPIFDTYQLNNIKLIDRLAIAQVNNGMYQVYDSKMSNTLGSISVQNIEQTTFEITNGSLIVKENGSIIKTIALN